MMSFRKILPAKFSLATIAMLISTPVLANELENSAVNLDVGNWTHQQRVFMGGREIPQTALGGTECLTQEESEQTVGEYLDEFAQNVGSDQMCEFSEIRGVAGDVVLDVMCSNPQGARTELTLNYEYAPQNVSIRGEGTVTIDGTNAPILIEASSVHVGPCS